MTQERIERAMKFRNGQRTKAIVTALFAGVVGCAFVQSALAAETAKFDEKVLWSFGSGTDGAHPDAALIFVDGVLYGTTWTGGGGSGGTVFAINPYSGAEKVVYSFCSQSYCADGATPYFSLISLRNKLYGTTSAGGGDGLGVAFAVNRSTGAEKVLHSFGDAGDGEAPDSSLASMEEALYGTTSMGGNGSGTLFALDRRTGAERVLYGFCRKTHCSDGEVPEGVIHSGDILYGVTYQGGNAYGGGTAFAFNLSKASEKVLYSFCSQSNCTDGNNPVGGLVVVGGLLYGTTESGGANTCEQDACGTVFSINPKTGAEKVLHSFGDGADGNTPVGGLVVVGDKLYGTTSYGGESLRGTVFSIDPTTGAEMVVYSFCSQINCTDGSFPDSGVVDVNGTLYGTTSGGGNNKNCQGGGSCGTVFSLSRQN